ncbi:MAG: hypothetical protein ACRDL7_03230 [Gaiellaceae bacterium]
MITRQNARVYQRPNVGRTRLEYQTASNCVHQAIGGRSSRGIWLPT